MRARATKKGRTAQDQTVTLAGWLLLVTTLDAATWPVDAVLELYRARWQIELVFKRMKSILQLDHLRVLHPTAVEFVVRLVLIGWLLQAETGTELRDWLMDVHQGTTLPGADDAPPLSSWRLTTWGVATLRQHILGSWTSAQVQACCSRLGRFLQLGRRDRRHLESTVRHRLAARWA